jgi:hypothetical protein
MPGSLTMRRALWIALVTIAIAAIPSPSDAKKHQRHKPAGLAGVVRDASCPGACADPPPPQPVYSGPVTITVTRATDGDQVASKAISDGHFRIRLKRGSYNVSAVPPNPPTCNPTPETVCPLAGAQSRAVIAPCLTGDTQPAKVRRHRFTHVELHVSNTCVV